MIAIPVGAFADPFFAAPQVSVWEQRKHRWVVVPDEDEHVHCGIACAHRANTNRLVGSWVRASASVVRIG
ncbi:MAG: hypothetical protein WBQ18_02970 [Solirubrobacteraceae bacterium]